MDNKKNSLSYLFFTFLKIGTFSFGGFMSLIAMIENQLTEKDKTIKREVLLDGISLTSLLPGPVAMNTVAFVGYKMKGFKGALVSLIAALIPSFLLMCVLSHFYFTYGEVHEVRAFFMGVIPAIWAVIFSTAFKMGKANLTDKKQIVIAILAAAILLLFKTGSFTILLLLSGGLLGYIFYHKDYEKTKSSASFPKKPVFSAAILIVICLFINPILEQLTSSIGGSFHQNFEIFSRFSSLSITLFGGGYVFIPIMQELLVENFAWLSQQEFIDGMALGQMTPGPIMITSTFVGYKVMGPVGALMATIGMFLPPAILTVYCTKLFEFLESSSIVKSAFKGIKPVVVGMIFSAGIIVAKGFDNLLFSYTIGLISFALLYFKNINLIYLLIVTGILGLIVF